MPEDPNAKDLIEESIFEDSIGICKEGLEDGLCFLLLCLRNLCCC